MLEAISLAVSDGALVKVPIYEQHKRGKNWCATIVLDESKPGGLSRLFWSICLPKYHAGAYYWVPCNIQAGDCIEFGADMVTRKDARQYQRRYYRVVQVLANRLDLVRFETGKAALQFKGQESFLFQ